MSFGLSRSNRFLSSFFLAAILASAAGAQQLPPIEPPQPLPTPTHPDSTTLRVTASEVLVPTLVEKRGGGIVYGLKPQDFVLEDNGVPQKIRVQGEMDTAPVALVVDLEMGGMSVLNSTSWPSWARCSISFSPTTEPGGAGRFRLQTPPDS